MGASRYVKFAIANYIPNRSHMSVFIAIRVHCNIYKKGGFMVQKIQMDAEFKDQEATMNTADEQLLCADKGKT